MQKIFKNGHIQNSCLTLDHELNIMPYIEAFLRHHIQELQTLKKWSGFLAHPVYVPWLKY